MTKLLQTKSVQLCLCKALCNDECLSTCKHIHADVAYLSFHVHVMSCRGHSDCATRGQKLSETTILCRVAFGLQGTMQQVTTPLHSLGAMHGQSTTF